MPWIIERYIRAGQSGFTPAKLAQATLALAEMQLGTIRVRSMPFVLRIEPCNVCNLRCPLCLCGNRRDTRPKGMMALDDFRQVLERTSKWAMITRLDGLGEPTQHPQIFELVRIAKSYGTSVVMHTNLETANCTHPEPFLESGLDRLVVSVDGADQETHERYRTGGNLETVVRRLRSLVEARRRRGQRRPILEMQTIDFDFNRNQQPALRELSRSIGVDRYQVTSVQRSLELSHYEPGRPKRCPWLWTVLSVAWNLDYRSCTNAWSFAWPHRNMRELPPESFWNSRAMQDARQYNLGQTSKSIASDPGCRCNRCYEMMVVPLRGEYTCD